MFDFGVLIWWVGAAMLGYAVLSIVRGSPHKCNRDAWLLQHFGAEGRDRWLCNEILTHNPSSRQIARIKAKYGENCWDIAHRTPDGYCSGIVRDNAWTQPILNYKNYPPWGNDGGYSRYHNELTEHEPIWHSCHGEPRGVDWLAAGFWDPITRKDGVVVNPIYVLYYDMIVFWMEHGTPDAVIVGGEKLRDKAERIARKSIIGDKFFHEQY